jgi:hypothetical protein
LPPLLILGGISGAGMTTAIAQYRPILVVLTVGFLGGAFYVTYRPVRSSADAGGDSGGAGSSAVPRRRYSKMMVFNKVMLWVATIAAVFFLLFPQAISNVFVSNESGFTDEMERTVLVIEGMT